MAHLSGPIVHTCCRFSVDSGYLANSSSIVAVLCSHLDAFVQPATRLSAAWSAPPVSRRSSVSACLIVTMRWPICRCNGSFWPSTRIVRCRRYVTAQLYTSDLVSHWLPLRNNQCKSDVRIIFGIFWSVRMGANECLSANRCFWLHSISVKRLWPLHYRRQMPVVCWLIMIVAADARKQRPEWGVLRTRNWELK